MDENANNLSNVQKTDAIANMLDYCLKNALPLPQHVHLYNAKYVEGSSTIWEFEAKISYIEGETQEDRNKRRRVWLRDWIRDVLRKATGTGVEIKKDWSTYFTVTLISDVDRWHIEYSVKREIVCEKKIVGKKVIPEHTVPEREEEEIEWICNDKSLLGDSEEGKE